MSGWEFGCVIGHPRPSVALTTARLAARVKSFLTPTMVNELRDESSLGGYEI
jgi:hypothetical protein